IDPTSIVFNPLQGFPGQRALGTDATEHLAVLDGAVTEMNRRIALLADMRTDSLPITDEHPLIVLLLEEFPGILSGAEQADKASGAKPAERIAPQLRLL